MKREIDEIVALAKSYYYYLDRNALDDINLSEFSDDFSVTVSKTGDSDIKFYEVGFSDVRIDVSLCEPICRDMTYIRLPVPCDTKHLFYIFKRAKEILVALEEKE